MTVPSTPLSEGRADGCSGVPSSAEAAALQREFVDTGVVTLRGAFPVEATERIGRVVRRHIERRTPARIDDRSTWPAGRQPACSFKSLKKHSAFVPLVENEAVRTALDVIFGSAGYAEPKPGAQVLVHFPEATGASWVLPDAWHTDCYFHGATWPVPAVKLFGFFGSVEPGGGGTMVLPGSHRVLERYAAQPDVPKDGGMKAWKPFMEHHPFLAQLLRGASMDGGGRSLVGQVGDVDGVPVEVRELSGEPGDVVITHFHVFHSRSPNCSDRPRQMLGKAVDAAKEHDAGQAPAASTP